MLYSTGFSKGILLWEWDVKHNSFMAIIQLHLLFDYVEAKFDSPYALVDCN